MPDFAPGDLLATDDFVLEVVGADDRHVIAWLFALPEPGVVPREADPAQLQPIRFHDKIEGPVELERAEVATWDLAPVRRASIVPPQHAAFAEAVAAARVSDPAPTFANLSAETGVPVADLMHYALVRWAAAGAEALLAVEPQALRDLFAARDAEDWEKVAGIVDWLRSGLDGEER